MAGRKRKRNPYRAMESVMTKVLIGDALLFCLYMYAANRVGGWEIVKTVAAVVSFLVSGLSLVWLYLKQEVTRRRSLWMVTACVTILACLLVSMCLGYPCPPVVEVIK